ncbi:MAG: tetratricopeptide repeat protein [Kiritimatiellae bacterium]|nr:tetratricopeptide repeat protein [Kiritimatiellia bacterium]
MNHPQDVSPSSPARVPGLAAVFCGLAAGVLYACTAAFSLLPGLPSTAIASALGLGDNLVFENPLFAVLVRLFDRTPAGAAAGATALSVLCGAWCVFAVSWLVSRIRPAGSPLPSGDEEDDGDARSARAVRSAQTLAAVVAGLFAAVSLPVWVVATRSLWGLFSCALLLLAAVGVERYRTRGGTWRLYLVSLLYGFGIPLYTGFILFAPLFFVCVLAAMRSRGAWSAKVPVLSALCLLPGIATYFLWAERFSHATPLSFLGYDGFWSVLYRGILRLQWFAIVHALPLPVLLLLLALTLVPAIILAIRPSPARRSGPMSLILRLVILAALLGALFDLPYAPWRMTGPNRAMPFAYLVMAGVAGEICAEFKILRARRPAIANWMTSALRALLPWVAMLVPAAILAAGAVNFPKADARGPARRFAAAEASFFDALEGRDLLLGNGIFDDWLLVAARGRGVPLRVLDMANARSARYADYLARTAFTDIRQQALLDAGIEPFLQEMLLSDEGVKSVAAIDETELLRSCGYLVPDGWINRAEAEAPDLATLAAKQAPLREALAGMRARPLAAANPLAPYESYLLRLAAKGANNLGYLFAEHGHPEEAMAQFAAARELAPDNLSALVNQVSTSERTGDAEAFERYKAEFEERLAIIGQGGVWSLSQRDGYVYDAAFFNQRGMLFVQSGQPAQAEAALRRAHGRKGLPPQVEAQLASAYLLSGDTEQSAAHYLEILRKNPDDGRALLALADIALKEGKPDEAQKFLDMLEAGGVDPAELGFERAAIALSHGDREGALSTLRGYLGTHGGSLPGWSLLAAILARDESSAEYEKAFSFIRRAAETATEPQMKLILANLYLSRGDTDEARRTLEQTVRMSPRLVLAWESLLRVDYAEKRIDLAEDHLQTLLSIDPRNAFGNLMMASTQVARGHLALAESSYRASLAAKRDPAALNDLASLILMRDGDTGEALALIGEALALAPDNPAFLFTAAEISRARGEWNAAMGHIRRILARVPNHAPTLLLAAQVSHDAGQDGAARRIVETISGRTGELSSEQLEALQALKMELASP